MRRGSLAEERPDLLSQWDINNEISPNEVSCGSHKKVWWICSKGHKWEATVKNRALIGSNCPYCEHRAVLKGYNDLKTLFPKIAKSWSPKNKLKPSEVSSRSNTEVLWKCKNGHEWKARVADRTEGHGCPYCAGQRVWKGYNDLATTHPALIAEWSDRNSSISPDEITYKNRSNVWWHCNRCGNDYQAVIYAKANGRICPFCIAKRLKYLRDQRLAKAIIEAECNYLLPQLAAIYYAGQHNLKVITDSEEPVGLPIAALIPEIRLAIDVCGSEKEVFLKDYICGVHGIRYINLSPKLSDAEITQAIRKAFSDTHIHFNTHIMDDLEIIRERYALWKKKGSNP